MAHMTATRGQRGARNRSAPFCSVFQARIGIDRPEGDQGADQGVLKGAAMSKDSAAAGVFVGVVVRVGALMLSGP